MRSFIFLVAISLVVLLLQPTHAKKNAKCSFYGQVKDKHTGEPLVGVKIHIKEINESVYTDFNGQFILNNLQNGLYSVTLSYISYQDSHIKFNLNSSSNGKKLFSLSSK